MPDITPETAKLFDDADGHIGHVRERVYTLIEHLAYLAHLTIEMDSRQRETPPVLQRMRPMHPETAWLVLELQERFGDLENAIAGISNAGATMGGLPCAKSVEEVREMLDDITRRRVS